MVNYLSLINHQGRLFITTPVPENDGLLAVIDFKQKSKAHQPIDIAFNANGDSFLIADSRGQVAYFQLANNRYTVLNQTNTNLISKVCFTGKQHPNDQAFIMFKDKSAQLHSLNGKLLDKFNQTQHTLEVKNLETNALMNMFLSVSPDACHIWTNISKNGSSSGVQKLRSIYAKDGLHFVSAKFSPDGQSVATLLKDGDILQWSLDTAVLLDEQILSLNFKSKQVTCFDHGISHLVAGGKDLPYLIYKQIYPQSLKSEQYFNLPTGCKGIDQLQLLRDRNLLAFLGRDGYFYIVDLSTQSESHNKIQVKLNIRIPKETIKSFQVDQNMNIVVLLTNNGNAYLYDLPKAFENERIISKKKIDMGLEEELVNVYLEPANEEELQNLRYNDQTQKHSVMQSLNNVPSFLNPSISQNQQLIESQDYIVGQSLNTINNVFAQKSLLQAQKHTLSNIPSNLVSIQQQSQIVSNSAKQEIMKSGLSTTMAKKQTYQKSSVSIVQSTMSNFNPCQSRIKSIMSNQQHLRSTIPNQQSQIESQYQLDENFQPDFKFTQSTLSQQSQIAQFNVPKLKQMLKQFDEYPDKYRFLTWKYLLGLPLNKETFSNLVRRGVHPAFKNLHKQYPIAQHRLYNKLVRTLSALGHWCPIFLDVDYLPAIVFPFIKIIPNDDLMVFELIMSLIVQYMQTWFESHPSDPISPLTAIDQIIEIENFSLFSHFKTQSFSPNIYAWPIMKNLFTEILSKEDWLKFVDHLFTYKEDPELLIYFAAAFLLSNKGALMNIHTAEELHNFQSTPTGISFKKIMTLAFKLHQKYSQQIFTGHISQNLPLIRNDGQLPYSEEYPVFNRYPEHIVQNQQNQRAKIAQEEEEILRKQALLEELKQKSEQVLINEENIRRQQEAALTAEMERKKKIQMEQEMLLQERIRLDEMTRLAKLEHIKKLEDAVMIAMNRQEELKKEEDKVAEEELNQRQRLAQYEYQARLQDEMINNLEFKANQRMMEMMQKNQSEEQIRKMKSEFEQRQREEEHRDKVVQERWRLEDQEQKMKNELFRQAMQQQTQTMKQLAEKAKIDEKFRLQEHQKELQLLQIEEQRRLRALEEEQILRKQQMLEEMRMRGEVLTQQEMDQKWAHLNYEREREKERARQRMDEIQREKERLDLAIEREKEEKERFDEIERRKRYEEDLIMNRTILSNFSENQTSQAENMKRQLQQEREDAERRRIEMMKKEAQYKDLDRSNLMQYIRATGENINNIVEKGQRELEERKLTREMNTNSSNQQIGKAANDNNDYQHLRIRDTTSLDYKIQERERQLKEQNERLLKQYSEEKENMRSSYNQAQPYNVNNQNTKEHYNNLQTQSFNPYAQQHDQTYNPRDNKFYGSGVTSDPATSSMSESNSSLSSSHGDTDAIQKHYQIKQQVEDYHKQFNPSQSTNNKVFTYQPQPQYPPTQLRGHHLPQELQTQDKQQQKRHKKNKNDKASIGSKDQDSYYNSSSSSNSSDDDEDSESQFSSSITDQQSSQMSQKQSAHFNQPAQQHQQQYNEMNNNTYHPYSNNQMLQQPPTFQSEDYSSLSSSSSQLTHSDQKQQQKQSQQQYMQNTYHQNQYGQQTYVPYQNNMNNNNGMSYNPYGGQNTATNQYNNQQQYVGTENDDDVVSSSDFSNSSKYNDSNRQYQHGNKLIQM